MKNKVVSLIMATLILAAGSSSVFSDESLSCEDLTDLADDLDEVAVAFNSAGTISEGDVVDQSLGLIVDALTMIAEVEGEGPLNNSVDKLISSYNDMDADVFGLSIDSVVANIDRLYRRDCE